MEQNLLAGQDDINNMVEELVRVADPDTGIVNLRSGVIAAEAEATRLAMDASASVASISQQAAAASETALARIESSGKSLTDNANSAWNALIGLAMVGLVVFAATRFMVDRAVSRPLADLCKKTENLSAGNMEPIGTLTSRAGEIGRMASALEVFRSNALKMEELREENARRQEDAQRQQQEMLALLSREIGTVVNAGSRGDFSRQGRTQL